MIRDILKYSMSGLWQRKTRSLLTVLSILIGITAIFLLISFGQGINFWVNDFAKEMGTDKIFLMPGSGLSAPPGESNIKFNDDDIDFIKKINGVEEATGSIMSTAKVKFKDYKEVYPYAMGFSTESSERKLVEEMFGGIDILEGRAIKKGDVLKAVLGYSYLVPNKMFRKAVSVGDKIEVNDIEVEVVGFYEEIGSPQDDAQIYMSLEGAEEIFDTDEYEYVYIRSAAGQKPGEVADRINEKFRKHRGQKEGEEDFVAQTFEDMLATFTNILLILNGVLVIIALISIAVAAVNITNTMYTSVLERTKEIGIMKAVGAKNRAILLIFVMESGFLGLVGGVIGVFVGYGFASLGGIIARSYGLGLLSPYFPLWLWVGCLVFAFVVGAGSGLLPARQASLQRPVESLRYE